MPNFQTLYRTVVMVAVVGLAVKAWFHFGMTIEKVQDIGAKALEVAQEAWNEYQNAPLAGQSVAGIPQPQLQPAPAPFAPPTIEPPPIHPAPAAPALHYPVELAGGLLPATAPALVDSVPIPTAPATLVPMDASPATGDRLTQLLQQLSDRGIRDLEVKPWGQGGQFYRFSCSAPLKNSPSFSRHFEAVAATPEAAVEQVAAEIDAWHRGQN